MIVMAAHHNRFTGFVSSQEQYAKSCRGNRPVAPCMNHPESADKFQKNKGIEHIAKHTCMTRAMDGLG